jgi:chemotaxis protein CheX
MPATQQISATLIRDNITRAINDVFKTMLSRTAKLIETPVEAGAAWPPVPEVAGEIRPQVVGTVGFIGEANGLIYFYLDLAFARLVTCQLLGMTEAELDEAGDEVVNDAIGELTNMTVGSFKNGLCDAGYPCMLTIPSILRGSNFCVEPISSAQRHIFRFDCAGHRVVTDILMKTGE